jgi:hypothetical protein
VSTRPADRVVALFTVKVVHTVVWAFFASCIVAIPVLTTLGRYPAAAVMGAVVMLEVLVLVLNRFRCPLTDVAARYTDERADNFDIYLPLWLARHNKLIFGTLYLVGLLYLLAQWLLRGAA